MVDRILLFKLIETLAPRDAAELLRREFSLLPELTLLTVGLPADEASAKSWDVSCVLRFEDLGALERALASDAFHACLNGTLKAHCAVVKAWSFAAL